MHKIECEKVKETAFYEKLENGLEIIIIPKNGIEKKYIMYTTKFGSIDNKFISPKTKEEVNIPDGVAHFLEHKMFEQADGTNSLDTLMAMGIDANAYTTNDHTAFLFECTSHFYDALTELMDYVQHPYFTDENVEKEKGIIGQEIQMYDDDPDWQCYVNLMDCLYKNNPIKIDIAGTIETISRITPQTLNTCYDVFYNPSNMVLVACGDFEPEKLLAEIKSRLVTRERETEIIRIYPEHEKEINKKEKEATMPISMPIFMIGFKDKIMKDAKEKVRRHIAIEILLNLIIGESSDLYNKLYQDGVLAKPVGLDYEFSDQYAHIVISGQATNAKEIHSQLHNEINKMLQNGIENKKFESIKKKIYGNYVVDYNNVGDIARMFTADWIKGIDSFDYIDEFTGITTDYVESVLKDAFKEENMAMSVVKSNNK